MSQVIWWVDITDILYLLYVFSLLLIDAKAAGVNELPMAQMVAPHMPPLLSFFFTSSISSEISLFCSHDLDICYCLKFH